MASSLRALRPAAATFARASAAVRPATSVASRYVIAFSRSASNDSMDSQQKRDLDVGELQGATFKIEPLRRVGEDPATMRARLLCTSFPALPYLSFHFLQQQQPSIETTAN